MKLYENKNIQMKELKEENFAKYQMKESEYAFDKN